MFIFVCARVCGARVRSDGSRKRKRTCRQAPSQEISLQAKSFAVLPSRGVLEKKYLPEQDFKNRVKMKRYGSRTYLMTLGVKNCYYELRDEPRSS